MVYCYWTSRWDRSTHPMNGYAVSCSATALLKEAEDVKRPHDASFNINHVNADGLGLNPMVPGLDRWLVCSQPIAGQRCGDWLVCRSVKSVAMGDEEDGSEKRARCYTLPQAVCSPTPSNKKRWHAGWGGDGREKDTGTNDNEVGHNWEPPHHKFIWFCSEGATGEEKEERKGVNKGGTRVFLITIEQK